MQKTIDLYANELSRLLINIPREDINTHTNVLIEACKNDNRVFIIGNGGSAATASHIACDLQKGINQIANEPFKVMSLTDSIPLLTAWSNDVGYRSVFAEQLYSLVEVDDVLLAISGSGNSDNIIEAVELANRTGAITLGWSGFDGGQLAKIVKHSLVIHSYNMQHVEDIHMIIGHMVFTLLKNFKTNGIM